MKSSPSVGRITELAAGELEQVRYPEQILAVQRAWQIQSRHYIQPRG